MNFQIIALNDQNSPRLADLATFKELSQELRVPEPNENEIEKLLDKLRLTTTQRQSLEKIISSEKIRNRLMILDFLSNHELEKIA